MIYLSSFTFPTVQEEEGYLHASRKLEVTCYKSVYPFRVLTDCMLSVIDFSEITILCGGNGSGKSTALNIIAEKLNIRRNTSYNRSAFFNDYLDFCTYEKGHVGTSEPINLKDNTVILTSDDVFKTMFDKRIHNNRLEERRNILSDDYQRMRHHSQEYAPRHINFETGENIKEFADITNIRNKRKTMSNFLKTKLENEKQCFSNGESGLGFFVENIKEDTLYLLDEPENSLSSDFQQRLAEFIVASVKCGCQFVIATHSPFLLAMDGAKIYNLDTMPASVCNWWEIDNIRHYQRLFKLHSDKFL